MHVIYAAKEEEFDFERVARVMEIMRWHWVGLPSGVTPSSDDLRNLLARLKGLFKPGNGNIGTGGLRWNGDGTVAFTSHQKGKALKAWNASAKTERP